MRHIESDLFIIIIIIIYLLLCFLEVGDLPSPHPLFRKSSVVTYFFLDCFNTGHDTKDLLSTYKHTNNPRNHAHTHADTPCNDVHARTQNVFYCCCCTDELAQ